MQLAVDWLHGLKQTLAFTVQRDDGMMDTYRQETVGLLV